MELHNVKIGQKIYFIGEPLAFEVKAVSDRYAVVVRKLYFFEDKELLEHLVFTGAYSDLNSAYEAKKDSPVYSILDFKENKCSTSNLVFEFFDYFKKVDCRKAIKWLENGKMLLSKRNIAEISIDWEKTNKQ